MGRDMKYALSAALFCAIGSSSVSASTFTDTSPTSAGLLPSQISTIGGIVTDFIGTNGARVVAQLAATELYRGFSGQDVNPLIVGIQTGFDPVILDELDGSLSEVAFRFTLEDGDTAAGDFDDGGANSLLVNGLDFGFWSGAQTQRTDAQGNALAATDFGFSNDELDTGFFYSDNPALLAQFLESVESSNELAFAVDDFTPNDNFYDFTLGVDGSLIDIGSSPTVDLGNATPTPRPNPGPGTPDPVDPDPIMPVPPTVVPVPAALPLIVFGFGALAFAGRRRKLS